MSLVPRLPTFKFATEAELLAAGESTGIEAGDLAFAVDTLTIYSCADPAAPTWNLVSGEGTVVNSSGYDLSDASVYADAQIPIPSPDGFPGWYYSNDVIVPAPRNKINWYFYASERQPGVITLAELEGLYALVVVTTIADPIFLQAYTKPEGPGDAGSFYRSRLTYLQPDPATSTPTPGIYLFHAAGLDVTNIFPGYPRVSCPLDPATSNGPQAPTEELLLANIATNSGAPPGTLDFSVSQVGLQSSNEGRANFALQANDLSPRTFRDFSGTAVDVRPFETLVITDDGSGTPLDISTFLPRSLGEQTAVFFPDGNPTQPVNIETLAGAIVYGPDGQASDGLGSTLAYAAGALPAGTQIVWRGTPLTTGPSGQPGTWVLVGTNYDTANVVPPTPSWPETLAVGQRTEGVMPTLQERTGFDPATEARDQIHTYWSSSGGPGGEAPPQAAVSNDEGYPTASYIVPIYAEEAAAGASNEIVAVLLEDGSIDGCEAIVQVNLVAKLVSTAGGAPSAANLKFKTTVWVDSQLGLLQQLDTAAGDVTSFEVTNDSNRIVLTYTDNTPSAVGNVTIHGMAMVQAATKVPLS